LQLHATSTSPSVSFHGCGEGWDRRDCVGCAALQTDKKKARISRQHREAGAGGQGQAPGRRRGGEGKQGRSEGGLCPRGVRMSAPSPVLRRAASGRGAVLVPVGAAREQTSDNATTRVGDSITQRCASRASAVLRSLAVWCGPLHWRTEATGQLPHETRCTSSEAQRRTLFVSLLPDASVLSAVA
jgi:hypothetical protein